MFGLQAQGPFEKLRIARLEQGYPARFAASGKKIYKVALVFSTNDGGMAGYMVVE